MKDIRIWAENAKRCEAVWLGYLLTLCGCQVWKGQLEEDCQGGKEIDNHQQYVNIILRDNLHAFGTCKALDINHTESLLDLMDDLCKLIAKNPFERSAILRITSLFINHDNLLSRCIYTIEELFCSRRINYTEYQNFDVLIHSVSQVETWLNEFIRKLGKELTYSEMFTILYLQNLINEGYIKARRRGGYDTSLILQNANYLLNHEVETDAVHFLKLQILHNSINFSERPDDILKTIMQQSKPEYMSKALCEVGDIYREKTGKTGDYEVADYYEEADTEDVDSYRGIYRAGLVYEEKGNINFKWYERAEEKYEQVIQLIEKIDLPYRTPQEYEYFYKAHYGAVKMSIRLDQRKGFIGQERKIFYHDTLEKITSECGNYKQIFFLKKLYGEDISKIYSLMDEKMSKVKSWANSLCSELQ